MNNIVKLSLMLAILISSAYSCIKPRCTKNWKFELPFMIENPENSCKLGDTIWMVSEFSSTLQDLNSPTVVAVDDFDFNISLNIEEIHGSPISWGADKFLVIQQQGKLTYGALQPTPDIGGNPGFFQLQHYYDSGHYSFRYGFIPQMEGVFLFSLNSHFRTAYDRIDFGTECNEEMDQVLFNMNNKTNNNFDLLSLSPDSRITSIPLDKFNEAGMYSFTVLPR